MDPSEIGRATAAWAFTAFAPGRTFSEVSLQIAGLNGPSTLQRQARHSLAAGHPRNGLLDGRRNIYSSSQSQSAVFEYMDRAGHTFVFGNELVKPAFQCGRRTHDLQS